MKANRIEPKSNKLKDLREYIAELSSVVRDKSPKSAEKLFSRLLSESVGDKASRVLEFIPCVINWNDVPNDKANYNQYFGFYLEDNYYTNARELLNWGWTMQQVLKYVDFTNYVVIKCETPYFVYGQISTHTQLTTVSHSQRYADCDRGYWMPNEVDEFTIDLVGNDKQEWWNTLCDNAKPCNLQNLMKNSGVNRKEVFDRGRDMLQNRVFVIGGYTNNPNAWQHFIKQRTDKHTQLETREFVKELLYPELEVNYDITFK